MTLFSPEKRVSPKKEVEGKLRFVMKTVGFSKPSSSLPQCLVLFTHALIQPKLYFLLKKRVFFKKNTQAEDKAC